MIRSLTATVLAAAIALGPFSAGPAKALDEKEILGLLAGAAAIAIIKKELDDRKDERRASEARRRNETRDQPYWNSRSRILPEECSFRLEDRQGRIRQVIGPRCLERKGVRLSRLPDRCLREVRTTRGWRNAYAARCMEREGWEIQGRRSAGTAHIPPRHDGNWARVDRALPGQCLFRLENRRGVLRDVVGPRCLERNEVRLSRLPGSCLTEVRTSRGWREAYALGCLEKNGWSIDGTRRIGN